MSTKSATSAVPGGPSAKEDAKSAEPVTHAKTTASAATREPLPDQCGLENDAQMWVRSLPPQVWTENETFYVRGNRVPFHPTDVIDVILEVQPYLKSEPAFIEDIPHPITIFTISLVCSTITRKATTPGYERAKFLFLGNYVDSGRQSIEVLMSLFCLKILYPDNIILLCGNHEFIDANIKFGFRDELYERFEPATAENIYKGFNQLFCYLSLCGLRKRIIWSHNDTTVHDLVMSDPAEGLKGTCFNSVRGSSIFFGEDAFFYAMHNIRCIGMFRGHSRLDAGFEVTWDACYTAFTCTVMDRKPNHGGFAMIDEKKKVCAVLFRYNKDRLEAEIRWARELREKREKKRGEKDEERKVRNDSGTGSIMQI